MKQATRRFLKYRPGAKYIERVAHRPDPNWEKGQCVFNAMRESEKQKAYYVPGWIIGDYRNGKTAIMFHYFNMDADGNYYDTIDTQDQQYDYIMDLGVDEQRVKHNGEYWWPPALSMTDDNLIAIFGLGGTGKIDDKQWRNRALHQLKPDELFDLRHIIKMNIGYEQMTPQQRQELLKEQVA